MRMATHHRFITTQKKVGETPLVALERAREEHAIASHVPLAYAGRLDPMASGLLLILVGDECKQQKKYHALDKEYLVELLFGIGSDTGDILGLVKQASSNTPIDWSMCEKVVREVLGAVTLPYPHFSSKTVHGKPLHVWTLEGRLDEIHIPLKQSVIHQIRLKHLRTISRTDVLSTVYKKIESIPPVTDPRKALGADFRRDAVRAHWRAIENGSKDTYQVLTFSCIASSGTYMRSLCEYMAIRLCTTGLAYSIHRTNIGRYRPLFGRFGVWTKRF
jgi:tRNA pseudouridine55 synthase